MVSSYVESALKQFNYRVKGSEKFWTEQGAEEMLQLRAGPAGHRRHLGGILATPPGRRNGPKPLPVSRMTTNLVTHPAERLPSVARGEARLCERKPLEGTLPPRQSRGTAIDILDSVESQ